MASFVKCTTADKLNVLVNLDHVALIRPHHSDRGFAGSEIVFSSGAPSSVIVEENQQQLATGSRVEPRRDQA